MPPRKSVGGDAPRRNEKETNWAIKKPDAEPLLRADIQHDVLSEIFNDRTFLFTAPVDQSAAPAEPIYLNFDQLYLEAILSSLKTTQNLRSKLIDNPAFAISFCKIALLINVGRVNTTMAFYPNMKTALRTYHPVPSLQADEPSRKDMQDAPRIKGILKGCYLDWEVTDQAQTLKDVATRLASPELTRGPPTTVVTLIFHLFNEASWVTEKYFPPGYDLLDLFYPSAIPSKSRARAFLSVVHHMLENRSFINDFASSTPPPLPLKVPIALTQQPEPGAAKENVDTQEELDYAKDMKLLRVGIVKTVPAYARREEELKGRETRRVEKEAERHAAAEGGAEPAKKRRRMDRKGKKVSNARMMQESKDTVVEILPEGWQADEWDRTEPKYSGLPSTWQRIKRDMLNNRDPDYDSDEDDAWDYDVLLRRQLVTVVNPATGVRAPPQELKEYAEWLRRRDAGEPDEDAASVGTGVAGEEDRSEAGGDDD
ncbi:hypothetical protein MNV49_006485 [Pseudohyphozyma bogoriensis]|nr:hypothetical protein MNV49_006485 [Pseudohyphozyma bogoriensis]